MTVLAAYCRCPSSLPAGTGRRSLAQKLSSSSASLVLFLTEHMSYKLPAVNARIGDHSFKSLFLQAQIKTDSQEQRCSCRNR